MINKTSFQTLVQYGILSYTFTYIALVHIFNSTTIQQSIHFNVMNNINKQFINYNEFKFPMPSFLKIKFHFSINQLFNRSLFHLPNEVTMNFPKKGKLCFVVSSKKSCLKLIWGF